MTRRSEAKWREYDFAADWCAREGLRGRPGDPLPNFLGLDVHQEINYDPEAFERRVRDCAYAIAMEKLSKNEDNT